MANETYKLVVREIDEEFIFFNLYNVESNDDTFRVYFYKEMWDELEKYLDLSKQVSTSATQALLNARYEPAESSDKFLNECIRTLSKLTLEQNTIEVVREKCTKQEHIDDPRAIVEVE
jgi:hypothetical protein